MVEIKQKNPKAFTQLTDKLKALQGIQGKTGWFESAKYEDGTPVAYVASIQEYGSGPIPPRSFMRTTITEKENNWADIAAQASRAVIAGKADPREAMEKLTLASENDVSKKIASITEPQLSVITLLARKYKKEGRKITGKVIGEIANELKQGPPDLSGVSTKPLVDTGLMLATLTSVVENAS